MRQVSSAAMRNLVGAALTTALLAGVGSGLFRAGQALAGPAGRRVDVAAAGIDPMPVGTARQVDRLRRLRSPK